MWKKLLFFLVVSSPAYASFNFTDFSGTPAIQVNKEAAIEANKLRMAHTVGRNFWESSAYYSSAVSLPANKSFSTAFSFQISGVTGGNNYMGVPKGGDGFTFVVHNDPDGLTQAGGGGSDLGYGGTARSVAIEFDLLGGGSDNSYAHLGVNIDGDMNSVVKTVAKPVAYDFSDGNIWYAWIAYDGTTISASLTSSDCSNPVTPDITHTVNLNTVLNNPAPSQAYVGFTAGTGGDNMDLHILSWKFNDSYSPVSCLSVSNPNLAITLDNAVYDPAVENRKAVPGEDMLHSATVVNTGGPVDADALAIVLDIPNPLSFKVGSITFTDAVGGGASGLTCCYSVEYSSTAGPAYTWTTTAPTGTYNPNVRGLRLIPSGAMNDGSSSATGFKFTYQTQIQ